MSHRLSRTAFEAGLEAAGITVPAERYRLWCAVLAAHLNQPTQRPPKGTRAGRPGWTREASQLLTPLRQYIYTLNARRSSFFTRFQGLKASDPKGNEHLLTDVYEHYVARCDAIYKRMHDTLATYGHLNNMVAGLDDPTRPLTRLSDIVRELRDRGEHAGAHHWSQWEDPKTVKAIRHLLGQMYTAREVAYGAPPSGRRWYAYEDGLQGQRAREEWEAAFSLWTNSIRSYAEANPNSVAAAAFSHYVHDAAVRRRMNDTMHEQRFLNRSPKSYPPGEAWRALPLDMRIHLATLHQACIDEEIAEGRASAATVSGFAPSEDELRAHGLLA